MIKKQYTKEQRYIFKMTASGYKRRKVWVHDDDWPKVQNYIARLRKQREKQQ